jgi:ferredoxin--NADP+ reductase
MDVFRELESREVVSPRCTVHFRFLVSPRELRIDDEGRVTAVELGHNTLGSDEKGSWVTDSGRISTIPTQLFLRSVGYMGRPLSGVGYCTKRGIVPADPQGRVLGEAGGPVPGLYVSGWMRRGPSGVIGTNKKDASDVADAMLADAARQGVSDQKEFQSWLSQTVTAAAISKADWVYIDGRETEAGQPHGRPRRKFLSAAEVARELAARSANV